MGEREAKDFPEPDDEAEERIVRARATIGKSFEELIARTEHRAAELGTVPLPAIDEPREEPRVQSWDAPVGTSPGLSTAPTGGEVERRIAEATAGIEARIGEWVNGRVQAAERRLELQSQALEASIGEGAAGAQQAIDQISQAKLEFAEARERARAEVAAAVDEGRGRVRTAADEQATGLLGAAEIRIGELEARLGDRLEERVAAAVAEAGVAKSLQGEVREGLQAAKAELEASFAAAITERQADSIERVEAILLREAAKGDARATDATRRIDASLAEAEGRAAAMIADLEERSAATITGLEEHAKATVAANDDRSAATIADLESRAAQLRAGLEEALRTSHAELERSREDEAAAAHASLDETIAGVLRDAETRLERMGIEMANASDRVASSADAAEARIDQRLASMSTELQDGLLRQVDVTLGDRIAELEPRLEQRLSEHVGREAEAAGKRADATLAEAAAREREQLDALVATESERARIAIERERNTNVGRAAAELAVVLADSRADLEQVAATLREGIEMTASQQAAETTRAELEARSGEIEERLSGMVQKVAADAEQRLLEAATIVEDRLTAVDRAQEREEIVRRRTSAAESTAERRVQEAEHRLMEVLARLEPAERQAD